ncbi:MAG: siderophore-interacting protein [Pseudomonadota bacterium]
MPTLNKWVADTAEKVFASQFRPVEVTAAEMLDERLKHVRLEGDLSASRYTDGNTIEFRVSDREFRHYTPSFYDREGGVCDVLFYLHGLGPGSDWASKLQVGSTTRLMGPSNKMAVRPEQTCHLLFGDESSMGFVNGFVKSAALKGQRCDVLLELDDAHKHWPELLNIEATVVEKSRELPADAAHRWLQQQTEAQWQALNDTAIYLTGRARSIQRLKQLFKSQGIDKRQVQTVPYWAENKRGL